MGNKKTISSVRSAAEKQNIPSGFLGVEWLATREEVRKKRPNVVEEQQGMLSESTSFCGRPANVTYYFGTDNLVLFIFTFTDQASSTSYSATRTQLINEYGAFPDATRDNDEFGPKLCATRNVKHFAIDHCLRELGGTSLEQVFLHAPRVKLRK